MQVAELFEDLKTRVSLFNMHVTGKSPSKDYGSVNKQTFILQVGLATEPQRCSRTPVVTAAFRSAPGRHSRGLLPQLLQRGGN